MSDSVFLRCLEAADLPGADRLRQAAGWNQTPRDWERILSLDPEGCFAAVDEGEIVGTATTTSFGLELAWIGMVLVDPARRKQGIGRSLLMRCLDYLREKGVRCVKLDATPAGRVLYEKLGFQVEWTLTRWERNGIEAPAVPGDCVAGRMAAGDWEEIARLDLEAFGVGRMALLKRLAEDSSEFLVCRGADGALEGAGLLRAGVNAYYVGPLMVRTEKAGFAILRGLLDAASGRRLFWDIPDGCAAAADWAEGQGFARQRPLIRMFLGENATPGVPARQWGIADPATG